MKLRDVWGSLSSGCGASCGAPAPLKNSHIIYKKRSLVVCLSCRPLFCKLAPASRAERPTRSPAHRPCASCRQVRIVGRANLSCVSKLGVQGIGVRCLLQLVAPINARSAGFTLAMSARTTSTPAGVGFMGQAARPGPAWPSDLRQLCGIYIL